MKKIILLCGILSLSGWVSAQKLKEAEVPAAVKGTFMKSYPNAKDVKWSKESETEFEAEFKNGSMTQAANFDVAGKWLVTETEIKKSEIPTPVMNTINKDFAGYKIEESERVEMPDKSVFYEVELEKGEVTYSVQISSQGKVLKKEEKKEAKD